MKYKIPQSFLLIALLSMMYSTSYARPFSPTPDIQRVINWANKLKGESFRNRPRYLPYCRAYARIAIKQVERRYSERCTNNIPLYTNDQADRWGPHAWTHKNWCLSVSAYASEKELLIRSRQLRSCISRQPRKNNNMQIRRNCQRNGKMHKAAARGNINFVRKCLRAGTSPNLRDENKWTPLHSAARFGRLSLVQLLLRKGAYVNAGDIHNRTPLDQAVRGKRNRVINYLIKKGGVQRRY